MEIYDSPMPLIAVLVSLLAAFLIAFSGARPNLRESWTILAAVIKFSVTVAMLPDVLQGRYPEITLFSISPGISLTLRADAAGMIFALSAATLWILTSFYSIGYVRGVPEKKQTRYFASFAVCVSATLGIAFSANLLTFFIFYELLTIATYPLVIHKESAEAMSSGRKYLAYLLTGGVALFVALGLTLHLAGTVDFQAGGLLPEGVDRGAVLVLFMLFLLAFGGKSGVMPLHAWLPSAMVAPTPVSALLHAVAVVKAGVFGFARAIGFVIGPEVLSEAGFADVLAVLAGATILLASLIAIQQDNLKRRLAYSTVGHLSYIVLGLALFSSNAWSGSLFHIVSHGMMKITLFFCAGAIYVKVHYENISELNGIGKQMPLTLGAFGLASMGLAGMPPISGFISKWYLMLGALEVQHLLLAFILLVSGLLNAGYLFSIVVRAFFTSSDKFTRFDEASPFMVVPLVVTAVFSFLLGLFPNYFHQLAATVAESVLPEVGL